MAADVKSLQSAPETTADILKRQLERRLMASVNRRLWNQF
jgi:hypothetical protein